MMGEEILEDVDVAEAHHEQGAHACRWVGDRIGSSDERDVTRHHSVIACIRARPQRRLRKRGGHANGFSEFPIPEVVHDVGENLDGEIRGENLSSAGPLSLLLTSGAAGIASTILRGKVVVMHVELSKARC